MDQFLTLALIWILSKFSTLYWICLLLDGDSNNDTNYNDSNDDNNNNSNDNINNNNGRGFV